MKQDAVLPSIGISFRWAQNPEQPSLKTTIVNWGNIGIMEKEMETTIVYWSTVVYFGILGCFR